MSFFMGSFIGDTHLSAILDNSFKNRSQLKGYEDSQLITAKERMRINKLIKQYVKPNSRITDKVSKFYHRYLAGYTVLGVQVRGTDHWRETIEQRLPPLMSWVKSARAILETLPQPRKIFIASDNDEVIENFVTFFGNQTVSFFNVFADTEYDTYFVNVHRPYHVLVTEVDRVFFVYIIYDLQPIPSDQKRMMQQPCWMTESFVLLSNMAAMSWSFLISRDWL